MELLMERREEYGCWRQRKTETAQIMTHNSTDNNRNNNHNKNHWYPQWFSMVILAIRPKWANCSEFGNDWLSKPEMEIRHRRYFHQNVGVSIAIFDYQALREWLNHLTGIHRIPHVNYQFGYILTLTMTLMAFKHQSWDSITNPLPPNIKDACRDTIATLSEYWIYSNNSTAMSL